MIRNLIWDVDGTLFDTYPAFDRAVSAALSDLGVSAPLVRIACLTKISLGHCIATLAHEPDVGVEEIERRYLEHYRSIPLEEQPPFPGVKHVCETICDIGGTNVIVTHRGKASTERLLAAHRMAHYFVDALTRDDDFPRKPDPAIFEAMIKKHAFDRKETLTIGDREIDILAGQTAGIRTCFFGTAQVAADYGITDYAELYRIILDENGARLE